MTSRLGRERQFHNQAYQEQSRAGLGKYYAIAGSSNQFYRQQLMPHARGQRVLEYGCGVGSLACELARLGAQVTGIDVSDVAIDLARRGAAQESLDIDFLVMNAEDLPFVDNAFDVVCGTGILHHLQLDRAFAELTRILKPEGRAIFLEPLGHNALINLYRRLTPEMRTPDEHPLRRADLELAQRCFQGVEPEYYHLTTLATVPFRGLAAFPALLTVLEATDRWLFRHLPVTRTYAWIVVLVMSAPIKDHAKPP